MQTSFAPTIDLPARRKAQWMAYKQENPKARNFEIAQALGWSEVEVLWAQSEGDNIIALRPDWAAIWESLPSLGKAMALTRNTWVVSECHGSYGVPHLNPRGGLVHGDNIDLRLFPQHWQTILAVTTQGPKGEMKSLQIFDRYGQAVHKIYPAAALDSKSFAALIDDFRVPLAEQMYLPETLPSFEGAPALAGAEREQLLSDWRALEDTHDFHSLLRRHGIDRLQALEAGRPEFVAERPVGFLIALLEAARDSQLPLMFFVANRGLIQIYSGPVKKLFTQGSWFNVLDPQFNLHIDTRGIERVFIVQKPTKFGTIWSLELFDGQGTLILSIFGSRQDKDESLDAWRQLLEKAHAP